MEIVIAVLVSLVAIAAIIGSRKFPGTGLSTDIGSARFPLIYSSALLVLSAILVIQNLRKTAAPPQRAAQTPGYPPKRHAPNYLKAVQRHGASVLCLVAMPYARLCADHRPLPVVPDVACWA